MKRRCKSGVARSIASLLVSVVVSSACEYVQASSLVSASDTNIQVTGRVDTSDPDNLIFAYPGVSIKAKFQGTSVAALLTEYGSGSTTTTNYFNVIIDGGTPTVLQLSSSQSVYTLATGLTDGEHTVELFKRTESNVGKVAFHGFQLETGKMLVAPDALPARSVEFIGNSITCGYGNELSTTSPNDYHFTSANENNYKAWGAVAARSLNAQYSCVAYSGRGLYQNNTGTKTGTLPLIYDQVIADDASTTWDHASYTPDVIVINLGTNDFSAETSSSAYTVDSATFVATYIDFVSKLRGYYPCASVVCCVGVMMSDYYPSGAQQWTRIQNYVSSVKTYMNSQGDTKVYYLKLDPQSSPYGEDWHPTAATDVVMANALTSFINSNITWNDVPAAPAVVTPVSYTRNSVATALVATGTDLKWYTTSTGGTASSTAPTPSTTTVGTTSYYVTQTVGCKESARAKIDVVVGAATTQSVTLKVGWNLVGCPLDGSTDLAKALSSIWSNVVAVKDYDSFWDVNNVSTFNSLSQLSWGKGYFVKVSAACELDWDVQ